MPRRKVKRQTQRRSEELVREVVATVVPAEGRARYVAFARELCATLKLGRKQGTVPRRGHVHGATRRNASRMCPRRTGPCEGTVPVFGAEQAGRDEVVSERAAWKSAVADRGRAGREALS